MSESAASGARQLREEAGTLSGQALGIETAAVGTGAAPVEADLPRRGTGWGPTAVSRTRADHPHRLVTESASAGAERSVAGAR
jgi:hypothetical protein